MSQYCTSCGNKLDYDSVFCSSCGNKVQGQNNVANDRRSYNQDNYSRNRDNFNRNTSDDFYRNDNRGYERNYDRSYDRNYDRSYSNNINNSFDINRAENIFMAYFINVFKNKYAMFNGRASRKEYWMFVLFNFLISLGLMIFEGIIGAYGVLFILYGLASFVPGIAIAVRRLHDIGKSGGMLFVQLIPIVGPIWIIILLCSEGQRGMNSYGDVPRI